MLFVLVMKLLPHFSSFLSLSSLPILSRVSIFCYQERHSRENVSQEKRIRDCLMFFCLLAFPAKGCSFYPCNSSLQSPDSSFSRRTSLSRFSQPSGSCFWEDQTLICVQEGPLFLRFWILSSPYFPTSYFSFQLLLLCYFNISSFLIFQTFI